MVLIKDKGNLREVTRPTETIEDHYDDPKEFWKTLVDAELNAEGDWEERFVVDLMERHEKYGVKTALTEKQKDILERIATK